MPIYPAITTLAAGGGLSLTTSNNTISFKGPIIVDYEPYPLFDAVTTTFGSSNGSWYFDPFYLPGQLTGGQIRRLFSFADSASVIRGTTGASYQSGTTGSRSVSLSYVHSLALYSLGAGTNSTRLESFWSNTFSLGIAQSVSVSSAAGTNMSVTNAVTLSYIKSIDSAGNYTTTTTTASTRVTSASANINSTAVTAFASDIYNLLTGKIIIAVGFNSTINPGNYWLGQGSSVASTTAGTSANVLSQIGQTALKGATTNYGRVFGNSASIVGFQPARGQGVWTTTSGAPPSTVAFSDINTIATRQYWNFANA